MTTQIGLWMRKIIASTVPGLLWMHSVLAQDELLTRTDVLEVRYSV
ncbi:MULTISPECIES: hypothetical protein [Chroococcidiopsis]|nr:MULTISPECIES: hypothetical protein [Chroococcidiopsis]URD49942.1 hypothetical protein M5J74_27000 [Chroococcidiopsis sp. CCNUC1]